MAQSTQGFRIFGISSVITLAVLTLIWAFMGLQATMLAALLIVIELTFSFDNAIVNAKILKTLSPFWQQLFLTVGIVIAVFGMRVLFPIAIVTFTSGLAWSNVINLALHYPEQYGHALEHAQPLIASFGGAFLLMLALHYFFDRDREVHWLPFERTLARMGVWWAPLLISVALLALVALAPGHGQHVGVLIAGFVGIVIFLLIHGLSELMEHSKELTGTKHKTGWAALAAFIYLQVLDASFSFDGVIGAFAITSEVIIIAAGLGVGAFWVRSLTVYMVRKGLLEQYDYLEHGAHYTILLLALLMFLSLFVHLPEAVPGLLGIVIIGWSVYSSIKQKKENA